jgi:hypothetical protein
MIARESRSPALAMLLLRSKQLLPRELALLPLLEAVRPRLRRYYRSGGRGMKKLIVLAALLEEQRR